HVTSYKWAGASHASESIKYVNNVEVARNLIRDPSFESGIDDLHLSTGVDRVIRNTSQADKVKSGHWSARTRGTEDNATTAYVWKDIDDIFGASWVGLSAHVYGENVASARAALRVAFLGQGLTTQYVEVHSVQDVRGGFHKLSGVAKIPAGYTSAQMMVYLYSDDGHLGAGWTAHDDWLFVVADSEQAALDSVLEYFDGSTDDVVIEPSVEPVLTGAYSFPFFPIFLADSTVQGEHDLTVEGDAPVWPVWEIQGPGRDVEIIGPDGSRLFVEGEVCRPIRSGTEPGNGSISDDSGLIWERMKPGDDQFFALQPGEQVIKMTMVGGTPESTIKAVYSENWKTPRGTAQGMIRGGAA